MRCAAVTSPFDKFRVTLVLAPLVQFRHAEPVEARRHSY